MILVIKQTTTTGAELVTYVDLEVFVNGGANTYKTHTKNDK